MSLWTELSATTTGQYVFGILIFLLFFFTIDCVWKLIHGSDLRRVSEADPHSIRLTVNGQHKDIERLEKKLQEVASNLNRVEHILITQDAKVLQEAKDMVEDTQHWVELTHTLETLMKKMAPHDLAREQFYHTPEYKKLKEEIDLYKVRG